jgi:hypothetical protein
MIELEEEVMRLCAMDADRVWDYNGVLKYYPQYLTQKPCRPLYLLSIPLSHLEIHFLRVFQDERMWQGAIVPWLRKQLGDTYETCKPVYNLIDQRDAFRKQRGNVHDFIAAATCAPKWAATQLQRNGTLLSGLIHEVVKYYRSRSYAVDLCRTFFGDGYEADDQKWILKVCSDSEAFDYVVLYENENERLDFAYATKSCFPDEFRTLRRIPDSVRD